MVSSSQPVGALFLGVLMLACETPSATDEDGGVRRDSGARRDGGMVVTPPDGSRSDGGRPDVVIPPRPDAGMIPRDPCIDDGTCPAGVWINVTPPDVVDVDFGPGPVVRDPGRPTDLYMAGGGDGLWKSTDYGNHWTRINDEIGYVPMGMVLAVASTTPATIWIAGYHVVLRSTDGGLNFEEFETGLEDSLYSLELDPYDNDHLISGRHELDGIVESTDGGETWEPVGTIGFPSDGVSWYVFFLDTGEASTTRQNWIAIPQNEASVVVTRDGGDHWFIPDGIEGLNHAHGNAQIYQHGTTIFVPGLGGPEGQGMYRSTDFGDTFERVFDGALSVAWGTDENVYTMWGWACSGCDLGAGFRRSTLAGDDWTDIEVPDELVIGANHVAVTSDGTHDIFVGTMWSTGVWRYVAP